MFFSKTNGSTFIDKGAYAALVDEANVKPQVEQMLLQKVQLLQVDLPLEAEVEQVLKTQLTR